VNPIDEPAVREFLHKRRNAVVATNRPDAAPQLSPIWFLWDGQRFILSAGRETAKAANIRRDPRVSLCIDDEPGARYLVASGRVEAVEDGEANRELGLVLIAKYKAPDEVLPHWEHLEANEPQQLFTMSPERLIWRDFSGRSEQSVAT
jgi:PPOX class probable F420-dependent enzyme